MKINWTRGLKHLIFDLKSALLLSPRFWWLYPGCIASFLRNPRRFLQIKRELEK